MSERSVSGRRGARFSDFCDNCAEEAENRLWKYCAKQEESAQTGGGAFENCAQRSEDAFNAPWVPTLGSW